MNLALAIVGAGIGGLTAALACRQAGFDVTVFESAPGIDTAGTAIELSPNATRILRAMHVLDDIAVRAVQPEALHFRSWQSGYLIASRPLGAFTANRYGAPHLHLLRRDLMAVLHAAAAARGVVLHFDARLAPIVADDTGVTVSDERLGTQRFDAMLGADGVHSALRNQLFGDAVRLFTGQVAWRALVRGDRVEERLVRPAMTRWLGPDAHFAHGFASQGEQIAILGIGHGDADAPESWHERHDTADFQACFSGWHPLVRKLIANAETCFRTALYDHAPLPSSVRGRVALLGDAWHPTLPFLDQGAALAIEDAWVVSRILEDWDHETIVDGLMEFESYRRARNARIQRAAVDQGALWQQPGRRDQVVRNLKLALHTRLLPELAMEQFDWLYGYDAVKGFG